MLRYLLLIFSILSLIPAVAQRPGIIKNYSYTLEGAMQGKDAEDSMDISISFAFPPAGRIYRFIPLPPAYRGTGLVTRIRIRDLDSLVNDPSVRFISPFTPPAEELTTGASDPSLNGISLVHKEFPFLTGDSLRILLKERRFDSSDLDLKGRVFHSALEHPNQTAHASLMATIISGAANSSPFAKGVAWKSSIGSSSFAQLFPDPSAVLINQGISVQNHSYGTLVENFYGNEAAAYDTQVYSLPYLVQVFSSGNSGTLTNGSGPYAGVPGYANLTGNFKHAKNILTAGSIDSSGHPMPLSSKGPAYDGRVKPELVAYGEDGSSGAAALVSGSALLLQHAYKRIHQQLPSVSLIKAVLINSADDAGRPGLDFACGYGSLNVPKAVKTILEDRFFEQVIEQDEIKTFVIPIPAGIAKARFTIVWTDPPALPNATASLVNNADMQVRYPVTGESWDPWVLNHAADSSLLGMPAERKIDSINNVEQITIAHPASGDYVISVKGSRINGNGQFFSVAYQLDAADEFFWTYPTHYLLAGSAQYLRWQTNISGPALIQYATEGANWRNAGMAELSGKHFRWNVPDSVSSAVLRIQLPSGALVLSDTITISRQLFVETGFDCADSFMLTWRDEATLYRLYTLGEKFLEPVGIFPDTGIVLYKTQHPSLYYSVAPIINSREGILSNTLNYTAQGAGCYLRAFFLQSQNNDAAFFTVQLGTVMGVAAVHLEKYRAGTGYNTISTRLNPMLPEFLFWDSTLVQGENLYRLRIRLSSGEIIYSDEERVYHFSGTPVVFFPNPVPQHGTLKVMCNESGRYILEIFDLDGRRMKRQELNSTLTTLHTGFLAKGLYIVRISDRSGKPFSSRLLIY